ncbi:MAG: cytochrome c [Rhodobiaceae bacterium]|nr:cytochrome c [Rhodobiaceae bacterium]MCC0048589.1 cytochrome c [Rhodobiaceae bacterium]
MRNVVIAAALALAAFAVYRIVINRSEAPTSSVSVVVPELLGDAQAGKEVFDATCAKCHGVNASGTNAGPPLVHKIYEPNHHADAAFLLAVRNGVRAHHWPYGDMPPVPAVTGADVAKIVAYVRQLQKANGIF